MILQILAYGERFVPGAVPDDSILYVLLVQLPIGLAPAMFAWLLPGLMRYRRGQMAWIGAAFSVFFCLLVLFKEAYEPARLWYPSLHHWLFTVFYIYGLLGLALCTVGILDRKRSAIWAMFATLSMVVAALIDTLIWLGLFSGSPKVPIGFVAFWVCIAMGYLRRYADKPQPPDLRESARIAANNQTRRARSIPRKLLREGNLHLLPVYYLISLSELGHEGIINSGSYRFADHIYVSKPSGTTALGKWLDAKILSMPATKAFRLRYLRSQDEIRRALEAFPPDENPLRVMAIPCGIPRDLTELCATLGRENPQLLARMHYFGMDVDPALLKLAEAFVGDAPVPHKTFHQGNALLRDEFPQVAFHAIVSTGLGEFLDDAQLRIFYGNVYDALAPGGTFYTSATRQEKRSDRVMRSFELNTSYRTTQQLESILRTWKWSRLTIAQDDSGLQSFVVAVK